MQNDNPAEMSNSDLEKDMEKKEDERATAAKRDAENVPEEKDASAADEEESSKIDMSTAYKRDEEQDLDDLVHIRSKEAHDGSLPDPEEAKLRGE